MYKTLISKEDIMRRIYSEEERKKIDSATPMHTWKEFPPANHVMNYNELHTFGKLDNLNDVAKKRGIVLYHRPEINWKDFNSLCYAVKTLEQFLAENPIHLEEEQALNILKEYLDFDKIQSELQEENAPI